MVAVVIAAPSASADTPGDADSPSVLAATLADAVTMATDAAQPDVVVVDPSRWQTVANIAATSLNNADASGSSGDTRNLLAGCLSEFAATGSAASDVLGSCADELGAVDGGIAPRLVAALELGDVSESAGPGSFDHTPAADEASSDSEPAEDTAPKPVEDEATGTGEAGTTTEEQSEPTDPTGVEAPSPEGPSPEANAGTAAATGEREADAAATPAPQRPRTWNRPGTKEFVAPSAGTVTSTMGDGRGHEGIDIANTLGAPIVAVADGEVIDAGPAQGFGLWVRIRHDDGTITTYGHNNDNLVEVGERVKAGQQIATVGNRGQSTGPHLHFEIEDSDGEIVDPVKWLAKRGASIVGLD
ncbi:peptidase M23 family protein [Rhodococcus opacus RKJ300 = JCM 13270]|uniref:Peptidase M23 family protein n=1 Tax=Rhodococcus opacus RKJ300 = JCM 13270 TaxID=1165867 RepID=I0WY57_RHOOP|nr:peptidase M23 family protein [Rhodococcus opacus RKJ300 = JCM 13270]